MFINLKNKRPEVKISPFAFVFAGFLFIDGTIFALIAFAAAMVHEAGHLAAAALMRVPVKKVEVYPLGAVITLGRPCSYRSDIAVKLAGGAANLCAAAVCAAAYSSDMMIFYFMLCNLVLAGFNLLPVRTLDGGEALYCALCIFFDMDRAAKLVRIASVCALAPLWMISTYVLFYTGCNFSLLLICGWLFFSAVMQVK